MKSRSIQMVLLDFDGVIIESAIIKKNAYRKLFEIFPGHEKAIQAYQETRGGIPRRQQFEEIYARVLRRTLSLEQKDDLEKRYVGLMLEEVMKAPFVEGAMEFLRDFHERLELYLVSATPEAELLRTVNSHGLEPYFRKIYGSPPAKAEILDRIFRETGRRPDEAVFIGDYPTDREAAEAAGVPFIARLGSVPEMEKCDVKIRDLSELPALLNGESPFR